MTSTEDRDELDRLIVEVRRTQADLAEMTVERDRWRQRAESRGEQKDRLLVALRKINLLSAAQNAHVPDEDGR